MVRPNRELQAMTTTEKQALKTIGKPEDVSALTAFLISDEAAWITGAAIDVDGGYALGSV